MKPFDFVFIGALIFTMGSVVLIAVQWIRRHHDVARRHLRRLAVFVGIYFGVEITVSLLTPQRVLAVGDARRFDDWCIAVTAVEVTDFIDGQTRAAPQEFVLLTLRVFSEARRINQSAPRASVHLLDERGGRYDVFAAGQEAFERTHGPQASLGSRLEPLGSFTTIRVFRVPVGLDHVDVLTPHGGGPGAFIIGDEASWLHAPTVIRVPLAR